MKKKKDIYVLLVGVAILLVLVVTGTFAYFQVESKTSTNTEITATTPEGSNIILRNLIDNLHIRLSASDMNLSSSREYYAASDESHNYETSIETGTHTIANVVLVKDEGNTYTCSGNIKINMNVDEGSMGSVLEPDDLILNIADNEDVINLKGEQLGIKEELDLSEIREEGTKEYPFSFEISHEDNEEIKIYVKFNNKTTAQNYLSGKELNMSVVVEDLSCKIKDQIPPTVKTFAIKGEDSQGTTLDNGYSYKENVTYEFSWDDNDVESYCLSTSSTECNDWQSAVGNKISTQKEGLISGEGEKTIYVYLKDETGNISKTTLESTKKIIIDQTPPEVKTLTLTGKDSNNGNLTTGYTYKTSINYKAEWDNNDVAYICVNNIETCGNYIETSGLKEKSASIELQQGEGEKTVYAYIKDKANNVSLVKTEKITVDTTLPVINTFTIVGKSVSGVTLTDSNLYSHTINVGYTFNWTELNTSAYCITSSTSCGTSEWVEITGTSVSNAVKALASSDGNKTMNAFVKDKAGNISLVASDSIMLDLTAPTVTIAKSSVTTSSITVTLGGSDGNGSGINNYQCRISTINNGNWENAISSGGTYQCTISGLHDGTTYTVEGRTIDKSGRISSTQTVSDTTEKKTIPALDLTKEENRPSGLSTSLLGNMYRFVGTKSTVNNYVCFGYSNAETDCKQGETSDYMYRIIGITQTGQLKLIKNTAIRESDNDSDKYYRWWTSSTEDISWPQSKVFLRLNGKGTNNTTGYTGDSNLFIDSTTSNVKYIQSKGDTTWYNKIEQNHSWWYGGIYGSNANKTANEIYQIETGQLATQQNYGDSSAVWSASQKVTAAIGLMYASDYYYSYTASGTDSSSTICYNNTSCKDSWLHISNNGKSSDYQYEWTMTRFGEDGYGTYYAWSVYSRGDLSYYKLSDVNSVRPVFYLATEASQIESGGDGSVSNPYIIVKE